MRNRGSDSMSMEFERRMTEVMEQQTKELREIKSVTQEIHKVVVQLEILNKCIKDLVEVVLKKKV